MRSCSGRCNPLTLLLKTGRKQCRLSHFVETEELYGNLEVGQDGKLEMLSSPKQPSPTAEAACTGMAEKVGVYRPHALLM